MAAISTMNKDGDWLASLARQSTAYDNKAAKPSNNSSKRKRKGNNSVVDESSVPLTKAQRIERREQKRVEREERKRLTEEARQRRIEKKKKLQKIKHNGTNTKRSAPTHHVHEKSTKLNNSYMSSMSKQALTQLSTTLNATVSSHAPQNHLATTNPKRTKKKKKNQEEDKDTTQHEQIIISNGLPSEPKGKATKSSTLRPQSKEIQPRTRDYNGQGLVRPSLYIPFDDPSFIPKFELEFEEHIMGFFGKSKTKAAKKQSDEKMLWRRCLKAKEEEEDEKGEGVGSSSGKNKKKRKKKGIGGMDSKIEGMMKQGVM